MGRLAPEGEPNRPSPYWPGVFMPRKTTTAPAKRVTPILHDPPPCDRCGFSHIDGVKIADAHYEVSTKNGIIYLCRHHYRMHWFHLVVERRYEVKELISLEVPE